MAKVSDVFGRLEAFAISVFVFIIGYSQMAGSNSVRTYASAQIFYASGSTGLQILQQIFIADTSNLLNRALFSTIPDIPFLITVWCGSPIAQSLLTNSTWRWGYGIWAIILPSAFLPLALSLFLNQRKASKLGLLAVSPWKGQRVSAVLKSLWYELDFFGLLLLCAAISLILIPLTLAPRAAGNWSNPSMITMLVIGGACILVFPFWERSKKFAPRAFFPRGLFHNRTVLAGTGIAFFYFSEQARLKSFNGQLTRKQWHFICLFSRTFIPISSSSKTSPSQLLDTSLKHSLLRQLSLLSSPLLLSSILATTNIS